MKHYRALAAGLISAAAVTLASGCGQQSGSGISPEVAAEPATTITRIRRAPTLSSMMSWAVS